MDIIFRTDASIEIGSGHVMRCLTLADALNVKDSRCVFICREHDGNLCDFIEQRGYEVLRLSIHDSVDSDLAHASWLGATQLQDANDCLKALESIELINYDLLVVDHYALEETWESIVGERAKIFFVIDDLADRAHNCDILLDQNLGRRESDYQRLVPTHCKCLIGAKYALLRPEFAELREYSLTRRKNSPQLKNLLITLGGVDKDNVTGQVLTTLKSVDLPEGMEITIVMGATAPHLYDVQEKAKKLPWKTDVVVNVTDMAHRMADADLAIGAAGSTSWERCCLGLPSILILLAENQRSILESLESSGSALRLNYLSDLAKVLELLSHDKLLLTLIKNSSRITNGDGCVNVHKKLFIEGD